MKRKPQHPKWPPTSVERYVSAVGSSTGVARVRTDAGDAFVKTLGNAQGPHALVREYVATALAKWFGLPTFEYALLRIDEIDEIRLGDGQMAQAGQAFAAKAHEGMTWSGDEKQLKLLENPEVITGLVVFDTWVLNRDRYSPQGMNRQPNYDNVFFSSEGCAPGRYRLIAMDFTHCFGTGSSLTKHVKDIGNVKDESIYGLFPAFEAYLDGKSLRQALAKMGELQRTSVHAIISQVPNEWGLAEDAKDALLEFILQRAVFLRGHLRDVLGPYVCEQGNLEIG